MKKENTTVSPNPRPHKTSVLRRLSVGQVIAVGTAHTYRKDYGYSDYSETNFVIEKISKKEIVGRSEQHKQEIITISRKDLDDYRFELRI